MNMRRAPARPTRRVWAGWVGLLCILAFNVPTSRSFAQDDEGGSEEETTFTVNAMMKLQGGLFVPLTSNLFSPYKNEAVRRDGTPFMPECDPILTPRKPCTPTDHGKKPGSPSITRATLQLEAHWDFSSKIALHAIVRGTRGMELEADEWAQVPTSLERAVLPDGQLEPLDHLADRRRAYAKRWVRDNQYNTFELREFYADFLPLELLGFRIGRQQVAWGETGSFRLLDVINPINSTWHFGPLESFEDQRVPLWMLVTNIEITKLLGALELIYIPGLDKSRDTVSTPLSMAGAWGAPYSNSPPTYRIAYRDFQYPGGKLFAPENMRGGVRWKGDIGEHASYSLVYTYTHMMGPVLQKVYMQRDPISGTYSSTDADRAELNFPRQHIAGLSFEYAFPSPIALTARFEGAFEPNRWFSNNTDRSGTLTNGVYTYTPKTKKVLNYAFVLQRPTMIRWLNPVQNFLLVAQFQHTHIFDVDDIKDVGLTNVVGFNDWRIPKNSYTVVGFATTQYLHGLIIPRLTGAMIINPDYKDDNPIKTSATYDEGQKILSGFVSFDVGFRVGPHYRFNVTVTDFFGGNPYRDIGLFRDRDEVHASATVLF
jgi:hypothetical protein